MIILAPRLRHSLALAATLFALVALLTESRGQDGYLFSTVAGRVGPITTAPGKLFHPLGVAIGQNGEIVVSQEFSAARVGTDGTVTSLAIMPPIDAVPWQQHDTYYFPPSGDTLTLWHWVGTSTTMGTQRGISLAMAKSGEIYLGYWMGGTVRKNVNDELSLVAEYWKQAPDSNALNRRGDMAWIASVACAPSGDIYAAGLTVKYEKSVTKDYAHAVLNKVSPDGTSTTVLDHGIKDPAAIAVDAAGNVFIADAGDFVIRKLATDGQLSDVAGQVGVSGSTDGAAATALFGGLAYPDYAPRADGPSGIAVDGNGNVFVADTLNDTIRRISPDGTVTTIGGQVRSYGSENGLGTAARFFLPQGLAVDKEGNLYIADTGNNVIRKGTPVYRPRFESRLITSTLLVGEQLTVGASTLPSPLPTRYQWQKDGVAIAGATTATYTVPSAQTSDSGKYTLVATNDVGSSTSVLGEVTVSPRPTSCIFNVSIRTGITSAAPLVTVGFVVTGGDKPLLVRGVGPALKPFGVGDAIADPTLTVYADRAIIATNDNWSTAANAAEAKSASAQVGAFELPASSLDAALLKSLGAGAYTAQITGVAGATGTALVELYDADPSTAPRLVNVSSRAQVGTGDNILVAGFAVYGSASKKLLIRAVGPTLAGFGVGGALSDPTVEIIPSGAVQPIASNDNWNGDTALAAAFTAVGAFPLGPTSKDAALIVTVAPGSYSAKVTGVGGTTGEALVEIYELP